MNGFWPLFRKEIRVFMWPMIGLFLIVNVGQLISVVVIYIVSPDFPESLFMMLQPNNSMIYTLFVKPVIGRTAMEYLYATLFLFSLIHEHTTRSREQLDMLPVRRMTTLAAKFCALTAWLFTAYMVAVWLFITVDRILVRLHYNAYTSSHPAIEHYTQMTIYNFAEILGILAIAADGMLGYVAAVSVRRFRVPVGTAVVFVGFALMSRYIEIAEYFFRGDVRFAGLRGLKMYEYSAAYYIIPNASAVCVLVAVSLVLYEWFGKD